MNKKEFLNALNETYCRLAVTRHGVGVVAIRPIPKGIDPFKNCDQGGTVIRIPESELEAYDAPPEAKELVKDFCALQKGVYHVPSFGIDAIDKSYFLNHSEKANMVTYDEGVTFITARDIKKGEELTANYHQYHEYVTVFSKKKRPAKK